MSTTQHDRIEGDPVPGPGPVRTRGGPTGPTGPTGAPGGRLDAVGSPADLRDLSTAELAELAAEVREVIVDAVLEHGGHLGLNFGAVELTLALHRVLSSPDDILLWDTGHQAYAHKLVTGRRDGFAELRQPGGMSGYPSRTESDHDWIENSHASTVLAYAHGLATAEASSVGSGRRVVAVIGDGALTGGMAYEGLNNLGHTGADCLVVLNDNGRSYAPTASRLSSPSGVDAAPWWHEVARRPGAAVDGTGPEDGAVPAGFFEALGVAWCGSVDGHDPEALEAALADAMGRRGPRLLHVVTQKGRGYAPAEQDPVKCLHDTSTAKVGSYTDTFGAALVELAAEDPRLVAITAAMPDSTGLLGFAERFPERFLDVGIAEQHAVTAAAGMAMGGLVPIVAVYATFLTRAIDQVVYDVGLHRLPVVFCLDRAGITGDDGASHHGVLDLALLSRVPGLRILAPSSLAELPVMLRDAVALATGPEPGPVAIRWAKTMPPTAAWTAEAGAGTAARRLRVGDEVCLVGVGKAVDACMGAAALLEQVGVGTTVWDVRCARPLDPELLVDAVAHRVVVSVEDGIREGGIGAALADQVAELTVGTSRPPRVRVLGTPTDFIAHGKPDAILAELGLGAHGVAEQALALLRATNAADAATPAPSSSSAIDRRGPATTLTTVGVPS